MHIRWTTILKEEISPPTYIRAWLTDWLTDWMNDWLTDWLSVCLIVWSYNVKIRCVFRNYAILIFILQIFLDTYYSMNFIGILSIFCFGDISLVYGVYEIINILLNLTLTEVYSIKCFKLVFTFFVVGF